MSTIHQTSNSVLGDRDVNAMIVDSDAAVNAGAKGDIKSMEYHRQMLQNKLEQEQDKTYVSPSDTIMSPCTAKLSAYRNKNIMKGTKPRSLFAKTSSKNLEASGNLFADKPTSQ